VLKAPPGIELAADLRERVGAAADEGEVGVWRRI
jgi:hypothetical protein